MSFRGHLLVSASVLALASAHLTGAFAQTAPANEPPPQPLPAVNVQPPAQKQKAAVKKAAPKATTPKSETQTAATPSITLPEIVNVAAPIRQIEPDNSASEMTFSG